MAAFGTFKSGVMSWFLPILFVLEFSLISDARMYQRGPPSQCVRIENKICQGNYNYTQFPNILGHEDHKEANRRFDEFEPLLHNECSQRVKFFLCSLHFPMCDPKIPYGIPACQEMCDEVRRKCEPYLNAFNLDWPETIQCERLPKVSENSCLHPESGLRDTKPEVPGQSKTPLSDVGRDEIDDVPADKQHRPNRRQKQNKHKNNRKDKKSKNRDNKKIPSNKEIMGDAPDVDDAPPIDESDVIEAEKNYIMTEEKVEIEEEVRKPHKFTPVEVGKGPIYPKAEPDYGINGYPDYSDTEYAPDSSQFNKERENEIPDYRCKNPDKFLYVERMNKCLPICDPNVDVMFSSVDKQFAYYWMLACSVLCIISSALTFGTFMVDSKRFRYPERPIIFLSLCYLLYSSAYLVRLGRGPDGSVSCVTEDEDDVQHVVMGDLENTGCTAVFFLLYYFGMAAAVWWVVLSITWFLAAGLKWGHEAIEALGFYFHLVAWLLPAIQTIVVLVMGRVDGDELTGLCYVGNLDADSLLYFVIVPLAVYLSVGALALGSGFLSLFKIRRVILRKSGEKDAGKLQKLMIKIGIFTVLYIVPTACVVAVNVYQYTNLTSWTEKAIARPCYPPDYQNPLIIPRTRFSRNVPETPQNSPVYDDQQFLYPYQEIEYPQRSHYPNYELRGYDTRTLMVSDPGYGQPRYPDQYQRAQYPYKPYQHDTGSERQDGKTDSSLFTGRGLVLVPGRYIPDYPPGSYYRRKNMYPLEFNAKMELLKNYANNRKGNTDSSRAVNEVIQQNEMAHDCHLVDSIPSFPIFAIKIFMSLLAGITSGIWIWSGKTYESWRMFCKTSWCGKSNRKKESITPHVSSTGNIHAPPSVTSQLLPKESARTRPDGEFPTEGNRYSYPVMSDHYRGYQPVAQEDHYKQSNDVTTYTSSVNMHSRPAGLTLGDIAREYSDNRDSDREIGGNRNYLRNSTNYVEQCSHNDVTQGVTKKNKSWFKNNKTTSKKARNNVSRDSFTNQSNRAIPNVYEDTPSNRGKVFNYNKQSSRNTDGAFKAPKGNKYEKNSSNRVRKYSESDMNKLTHVSQSGFSPMSTSTRRKAESVHVGTMTCT